jgi:tetratricopeptide (TPR) repeat protein
MNRKLSFILSLMLLFIPLSVLAETIILKSGKRVEGKILKKTDSYIKVDINGIVITYYLDEIKNINYNPAVSFVTAPSVHLVPTAEEKLGYNKCKQGDIDACHGLGELKEKSGKYKEAAKIYQEACGKGHEGSCIAWARMYSVKGNYIAAYQILQKPCDNGQVEACTELGNAYLVLQKPKEAKRLWQASCGKGDDTACSFLNSLREIKTDPEHISKACQDPTARPFCTTLLILQALEDGDIDKAKELAKAICNKKIHYKTQDKLNETGMFLAGRLEDSESCKTLALIEYFSGNAEEAIAILEESCNNGYKMSCKLMWEMRNPFDLSRYYGSSNQ